MLFDLQSTRRRRTTVKIVYAFLAILMAGGLIFLGVGTGNGNGGLANSFDNNGSSGSAVSNSLVNSELTAAEKKVKSAPNSAASWAAMLNARYDAALSGSNFDSSTGALSAGGKAQMQQALAAWEKYSSLQKGNPSEEAAAQGARAAVATADFTEATVAWQGFIASVPASDQGYTCLALSAYAAKNTTLGSEAAAKAVTLTSKLEQLQAKQAFAAAKTQATAKADATGECGPQ